MSVASTGESERGAGAAAARRGLALFFKRLFKEKPAGAAGLIVVLLFFLTGVFAHRLAPHDYADQDVPRRLEGPSAEFLLGTDQFGRDSLSRIIHGARISMVVGLLASAFTVTTATLLGVISGYWGGTFDLMLQRLVDAVMSFPWLFLVLTAMLLLGPSILSIAVVIGVPWGIANVRTIRSVVLSVREDAYVVAARATGARPRRILARHVLPQTIAPNIILFTVTLGSAIIGEATVSFLGFGIPPPQPTWGGMLSAEGRKYMEAAPALALWPGLCLAIVVFAINIFGDALRDLLDPRLRGGAGRFDHARGGGAAGAQQ